MKWDAKTLRPAWKLSNTRKIKLTRLCLHNYSHLRKPLRLKLCKMTERWLAFHSNCITLPHTSSSMQDDNYIMLKIEKFINQSTKYLYISNIKKTVPPWIYNRLEHFIGMSEFSTVMIKIECCKRFLHKQQHSTIELLQTINLTTAKNQLTDLKTWNRILPTAVTESTKTSITSRLQIRNQNNPKICWLQLRINMPIHFIWSIIVDLVNSDKAWHTISYIHNNCTKSKQMQNLS